MTGDGGEGASVPAPDPGLERIIESVSLGRDLDLRGYKRSTLYRRLRKRLSDAGCAPEEYLACLARDPQEYPRLLSILLIGVTEFFRDPESWDALEPHLCGLLAAEPPGQPVRGWSAGCAAGHEAYSAAIMLVELVERAGAREIRVYATDVDERSLQLARAGVYGADELRNVPEERLERHFESLPGDRYRVRPELRSLVVFGRHNLLTDPPISRLDLLVCRNLLIYLQGSTQQELLPRLHQAVRQDGYLFLGKAETVPSGTSLFRTIDSTHRIFQRLRERNGSRE